MKKFLSFFCNVQQSLNGRPLTKTLSPKQRPKDPIDSFNRHGRSIPQTQALPPRAIICYLGVTSIFSARSCAQIPQYLRANENLRYLPAKSATSATSATSALHPRANIRAQSYLKFKLWQRCDRLLSNPDNRNKIIKSYSVMIRSVTQSGPENFSD